MTNSPTLCNIIKEKIITDMTKEYKDFLVSINLPIDSTIKNDIERFRKELDISLRINNDLSLDVIESESIYYFKESINKKYNKHRYGDKVRIQDR